VEEPPKQEWAIAELQPAVDAPLASEHARWASSRNCEPVHSPLAAGFRSLALTSPWFRSP